MYARPQHVLSDDEARAALAAFDRLAVLITPDLRATHLPIILDGDRILAHVARANEHWKSAPCAALIVAPGPEGYVSPGWYPSKAEHGRVAPTWNYEAIHVRGHLTVFEDEARLRDIVERFTARHEATQPKPWTIDEAPADYVAALLRGFVGVELAIESVVAKRKLSQERPGDRDSVIAALSASTEPRDVALARAMRDTPTS